MAQTPGDYEMDADQDLARLSPLAFSDETPGRADPAIAAQPQDDVIAKVNETRDMIRSIDHATARIDGVGNPAFVICERTGMIIEAERLDLIPWTMPSSLGAKLVERDSARAI